MQNQEYYMVKTFDGFLIQLYYFDNIKYTELTQLQKNCLLHLQGKILNDLPLIGAFCSSKCTMEQVRIESSRVYFKFNFEIEEIKQEQGRPVRYIYNKIVESINFLSKGISAVVSEEEIKYEKILSIINAIPSYVSLRLNPGFQFQYKVPSFKEVTLEEGKLKYIRAFMDNNLVVIKQENFSYFTFVKDVNPTEELIFLNATPLKGKVKAIEYYYKAEDGKKSFNLNFSGRIYSTFIIEDNCFNELVGLVYLLYKQPKVEEILKPIDNLVGEYLELLHEQPTTEAKVRKTALITSELKDMINVVIKNGNTKIVFATLVLNILVNLCRKKEIYTDYCIPIELMEYSTLVDFLKLYSKKKFGENISEARFSTIFCEMSHLVQLSQLEAEKLINLYNRGGKS